MTIELMGRIARYTACRMNARDRNQDDLGRGWLCGVYDNVISRRLRGDRCLRRRDCSWNWSGSFGRFNWS